MRKKKVILVIVLVFLGAGLAVFLLMRDSGPPVVVSGNLSAEDIAQIKSAVRRELWREALPNFSWAAIKSLPRSSRRVTKVRIVRISDFSFLNGTQLARVEITEPHEPGHIQMPDFIDVTNGPSGWAFHQKYIPYD